MNKKIDKVDAALCMAIGQIALDHGENFPMVKSLRKIRDNLKKQKKVLNDLIGKIHS